MDQIRYRLKTMSSDDLTSVEKANLGNMLAKLKAGKVLTQTEERRLKEYQQRQEAQKQENADAKSPKRKLQVISVDTHALADFLGVTTQRISQLVSEGIAVRMGKSRFDLRESGKRYIQSLKARQSGSRIIDPEEGGDGKPQSLEAAKLQKVMIETKRAQLAYEKDRGALVLIDEVRESGVKVGAFVSATLQSKPSEWAPLLAGKQEDDIMEILRSEVGVMLTQFKKEIAHGTV
jgi:phage terminase Nu1 subunit (DNA packaging protein)